MKKVSVEEAEEEVSGKIPPFVSTNGIANTSQNGTAQTGNTDLLNLWITSQS